MSGVTISYAYIVYRENNFGTYNKPDSTRITYIFKNRDDERSIKPQHENDFIMGQKYHFKKCKCKVIDIECFDGQKCEEYAWKEAKILHLAGDFNRHFTQFSCAIAFIYILN